MRFIRRVMKAGLVLTLLLLAIGGAIFMTTIGKMFSVMDEAMQTAGQPITPDADTHSAISNGDALGAMAGLLDNPRVRALAGGSQKAGSEGMVAKLLQSSKVQAGLAQLAQNEEAREGLAKLIDDPALTAELNKIMTSPNAEMAFQSLAQDPRVQAALIELVSSPQAQQALLQFATDPALQQQVLAQIDDPTLHALVAQTVVDPQAQAALAHFAQDPAAQAALLASLAGSAAGGSASNAMLEELAAESGLDPAMIASLMPSLLEAVQAQGGPIPGYTPMGVVPVQARPTAPAMTGRFKITVNDYIRVHTGMHMAEVVQILGGEGAQVAEETVAGTKQTTHVWLNVDGSYVSVIMRADMVLDASQHNLPLSFDE